MVATVRIQMFKLPFASRPVLFQMKVGYIMDINPLKLLQQSVNLRFVFTGFV
jgi:hypothetical protein